jgi:O-antigen ligase
VIIYVIFLLSGIIKSFIYIDFFPFDLTLITGIYCVGVILFDVVTSKRATIPGMQVPLLLLLLFYAWLAYSLLYTPSLSYAYEKYALSYLNLIAFCYPIFCKFCFKTFVRSVISISLILLVLFVTFRLTFSYEFMKDNNLKSIYLSLGVLLGFALIFMRTIEHRFQFGLFLVLLFGLIISTARGPLMFYVFSILIVKMFGYESSRNEYKKFKVSYILIPTLILILIITNASALQSVMNLLQNTTIRFAAFLSPTGGESVSGRLELFHQAIDMFSENVFLGNGLGSFGLYHTGSDIKSHPHNILLELLSETGLVSVLIFFVFILSIFKKLINNDIIMIVSLYSFMNMMKSNSFEELRIFFGFLAVGLLYAREVEITK